MSKFPTNVNVLSLRGAPQSGKSTMARRLAHIAEVSGLEYIYGVPTQTMARDLLKRHGLAGLRGGKLRPQDITPTVDLLIIDDADWGKLPYGEDDIHALAVVMSLRPRFAQIIVIETERGETDYQRAWQHGYNQRDAEVKGALI